MRINAANNNVSNRWYRGRGIKFPIYLRSMLSKDGGADDYVITRVRKANAVFVQLCPVWQTAGKIATRTKIRI